MQMIWSLSFFVYLVLGVSPQQFLYNTNGSVQNIIYDDSNKRVFVGGTNKILRLSVSILPELTNFRAMNL